VDSVFQEVFDSRDDFTDAFMDGKHADNCEPWSVRVTIGVGGETHNISFEVFAPSNPGACKRVMDHLAKIPQAQRLRKRDMETRVMNRLADRNRELERKLAAVEAPTDG